MLVAAAVAPCPPVLVPEVASGAAAELDDLRAACGAAIAVLAAARPDLLVAVGPGDEPGEVAHPQGAAGSFRSFGVELDVALGRPAASAAEGPGRTLPPSLAVAAWLLDRGGWCAAPVAGLAVGERLPTADCLAAGRRLAGSAARVALLVMGDGSACRTAKAPGYLDERAAAFDARVAGALAAADPAELAALDPGTAAELQAAGRAPWQVLAGAAQGVRPTGELLYDQAPYGVGYHVATWS